MPAVYAFDLALVGDRVAFVGLEGLEGEEDVVPLPLDSPLGRE